MGRARHADHAVRKHVGQRYRSRRRPWQPGASAQFPVAVQITSDGRYFDQNGTTMVTVQNAALPPFDPGSCSTTTIPNTSAPTACYFAERSAAAQPARLYYYHDDADDARQLIVVLQNTGDAPASVQLTDAIAGPNIDVMQVGAIAERGDSS